MNNWVDVPYEKAGEALKWVRKNCATYSTVDVFPVPGSVVGAEPFCRFYFHGSPDATSRDRVIFQLRWA